MPRQSIARFTAWACIAACFGAAAEPLTREQGDAILQELRSIRQLLERQPPAAQRPAAAPAPAPAPAPVPEVLKVGTKGAAALGRADAPVTMVAFMDYECPFCKRFESQTFPEIRKQYIDTGKVRYIVRDLPLDFHRSAMKAAEATHCAGEQGKIWEMREKLMAAFPRIQPELLPGYAGEIGLDAAALKSCMDSGRYADGLRRDAGAVQAMGIAGTPTFVIGKTGNGETLEGLKVVGAQPFASFDQHIRNLLQK